MEQGDGQGLLTIAPLWLRAANLYQLLCPLLACLDTCFPACLPGHLLPCLPACLPTCRFKRGYKNVINKGIELNTQVGVESDVF